MSSVSLTCPLPPYVKRVTDLSPATFSATRCNKDFLVEDLESCHRARGFNGIGYHYYITKDGKLHPTRSEDVQGAHAKHYNKNSIGICYEGGLDEKGKPADTRTEAQKRTLHALLYSLKADYPEYASESWTTLS